MDYIYLYGMVMSTEAFLLKGEFPKADGYGEIKEKYHHVGGETGTAAAVLTSLGCNVRLGGSHIGNTNREIIRSYFSEKSVELSELIDEDFDGIVDYVLIDRDTRTCFGEWEKHFGREKPFYEPPSEESVKNAACCGIDPFFCCDKSVELCRKYNKAFATIDCDYDSAMNRYCAVNAVSHQYLEGHYPDKSFEELFKLYTDNTAGLVIFTCGEKEVIYGRKGQSPKYFKPYSLDVVSTLGAGDSFKAGTVYALYNKMSDDDIVKYACAVAGIACTKFPIPKNPPLLSEVKALTEGDKLTEVFMYERMLNKQSIPTIEEMTKFCGENSERFSLLNKWLVSAFNTEQKIVFPYGNKYGWGVAHKKKNKLVCNVFAENNAFTVMIRLSDKQYKTVYDQLQKYTQECIDNKYPCGDGGWIHYRVTCKKDFDDIKTLLSVKCS